LDFPHAAQRICQIGEAVLGGEHARLRAWQTRPLHDRKHQGATAVLERVHSFAAGQPTGGIVAENLADLEKRVAQMPYASFVAQGWPIGSGMARVPTR